MSKALTKLCLLGLAWLVAVAWAAPAQAHRLNVFAYAEGDAILLESEFNSGRPAQNAAVTLSDEASGEVLATAVTDTKGKASLSIPAKAREGRLSLEVVVDAGGGHKGSWPLAPADYLGAAAGAATDAAAPATPAAAVASGGGVTVPGLDQAALAKIVEAAVEKKIAPMRAMLMESKLAGPGVTEIVGGIGWIFGLVGMAAWVKGRRR